MAKKYTIPFKSLSNKDCRIDIFDRDYSGDVITVSPANPDTPGYAAANPVTIQEEDNENLLTVLRPKTGYLTLVEKTFGSFRDLYPESNTQISVEIYYDGTIVFYGFIQAQAFENSYEAAPRVIQIPIMSPLTLMDGWNFGNDPRISDSMIGEYLDECLSVYDEIILPRDLVTNPESGTNTPLQMKVNNRIVCPWNDQYDYGLRTDGVEPSCYTPITYQDFIEAFCHLYGLVAHEFGKTIIFSKFDYNGQYILMDVGDLQEDTYTTAGMPTGATVIAYESAFDACGTKSREGLVLPIKKLTYDYGEYTDEVPMDLSRSKYVARVALTDYELNCAILNPQTQEFHSNFFTTAGGVLDNTNHVRVLGDGSKEMVELRVITPAGESSDVELFRYNFSNVPVNISGARFETSFKHEEGEADTTLRMQVISGGRYYTTSHDWTTTPTFIPITFDKDGKCKTYDVGSNARNVIIKIFPPSASGTSVIGVFYDITLEVFADPLDRYELPIDTRKIVINANPSYTEDSIDMLMHTAIGNSRRLTGGYVQRWPYNYMFSSQVRHIRQVKMKTATDMRLAYLMRVTTTAMTGRWRIISFNFNPWDDEWLITMHRSSTI